MGLEARHYVSSRWARIRIRKRPPNLWKLRARDEDERLMLAEQAVSGASDWKDIECAVQPMSDVHNTVALIDSWLSADEEETKEQKETWQFLRATLREHPV